MAVLGSLIGSVPITDAERSKAFYVDVLGLEFVQDDGFALVLQSGANRMRLVKMPQVTPAPFTILGWQSAQIEADVQALTARAFRSCGLASWSRTRLASGPHPATARP